MSEAGLRLLVAYLEERGVTLFYDGETLLLKWPTSRDAPGLRPVIRLYYDALATRAERLPDGVLSWACARCGQHEVSEGLYDRCPYCEPTPPLLARDIPIPRPTAELPDWHPARHDGSVTPPRSAPRSARSTERPSRPAAELPPWHPRYRGRS